MITEIRDYNRALYRSILTVEDMSPAERVKLRSEITKRLRSWFKWADYGEQYRHLVYYVELDGRAHVYVSGYLMTEEEFEKDVATREGVGYVGAIHRR